MRHSEIRQAAREARAAQRRRVWAGVALALVVALILVCDHYSHFSSPTFGASAIAIGLALIPLAALLDRLHSGRILSLSGARAEISTQLAASAKRIAEALFLAASRINAARRRKPAPPARVRARQIASLTLAPRLLAQRPQAARAIRAG